MTFNWNKESQAKVGTIAEDDRTVDPLGKLNDESRAMSLAAAAGSVFSNGLTLSRYSAIARPTVLRLHGSSTSVKIANVYR